MVVKTWEEKEQFRFPKSFGIPKEVKNVTVTPQYELSEMEDSIQIVGIYHITCHVQFEEGEHAHHATSEFTEIEDLDVQGEVGYFEYAVPMTVEISKEKMQAGTAPKINVQQVNSKPTEHEAIEVAWTALFEYEGAKEPEPQKTALAAQTEPEFKLELTEPTVQTVLAEPEIIDENLRESELQFILELDDGYSRLSFPSNNVFVKQKTEE